MALYPDEHLLRTSDIIYYPLSSSLQVSCGAEITKIKEWQRRLIKSESYGRNHSWRVTLGMKLFPSETEKRKPGSGLPLREWELLRCHLRPATSVRARYLHNNSRLSSAVAVLGLLIKFWNNQETLEQHRNVIALHTETRSTNLIRYATAALISWTFSLN
jgi:hypothetical protein